MATRTDLPMAAPSPPERRVTLDLHDIPLRAALVKLFEGSGLNFAVEPGVPNVAITLSLRDESVDTGLRRIIDSLSTQSPSVIAIRQNGLYMIKPGDVTYTIGAPAPRRGAFTSRPPAQTWFMRTIRAALRSGASEHQS